MISAAPLSAGISFLAGLVSFVSPCVLPLVPAYLSLLTGESLEELREGQRAAARALPHALAFIAGFSVIFVFGFGLAATALGALLGESNKLVIAEIGGVVIVVLGLQMMGMLHRIPFLMRDTRVQIAHERRTIWTSFIVGIAFAAGWTPCIGPTLGAIIGISLQQHNAAAALFLLLCYSLGFAIPFFIVAVAIDAILPWLARMRRALGAIEFASGAFLVAVGLVLANDAFLKVAGWFYSFVPTPKI
ncbi:MAG TPA: cytochrome c biogenesis CcdA family protein [Candidatus Tyrphobacter sp.]